LVEYFFIEKVLIQDIEKATSTQNQEHVNADEDNDHNEVDIDILMLDHAVQAGFRKPNHSARIT
jgi:hypothetical protein